MQHCVFNDKTPFCRAAHGDSEGRFHEISVQSEELVNGNVWDLLCHPLHMVEILSRYYFAPILFMRIHPGKPQTLGTLLKEGPNKFFFAVWGNDC